LGTSGFKGSPQKAKEKEPKKKADPSDSAESIKLGQRHKEKERVGRGNLGRRKVCVLPSFP